MAFKIPRWAKEMMVTMRPAKDGEIPSFENESQSEARLQQQIKDDKVRAVKNIASRIDNKKDLIKLAKGKVKVQEMLQQQLAELEQEQFELLRDEILNACKDSAGLIDEEKLVRFPGSSGFIKKTLKKNKPKN